MDKCGLELLVSLQIEFSRDQRKEVVFCKGNFFLGGAGGRSGQIVKEFNCAKDKNGPP